MQGPAPLAPNSRQDGLSPRHTSSNPDQGVFLRPHANTRTSLSVICVAGLVLSAPAIAQETPPAQAALRASLEQRLQDSNARLRQQIKRERDQHAAQLNAERLKHRANLDNARKSARVTALAAPGVDHALRLASATYEVPYARLRSVAVCESGLRPHAVGGQYVGLFQFGTPLWNATPYSAFDRADPYAAALAGAWAFGRGMASHWPICGR